VIYDPVKDAVRTSSEVISYPFVKIYIPARNFTGYLQLFGLHPLIPSGTIVHGKKVGNATLKLYSAATISNDDSRAME